MKRIFGEVQTGVFQFELTIVIIGWALMNPASLPIAGANTLARLLLWASE